VSNLQDTEINNLLSESVAKIAIVPLVLGAGEQLFSDLDMRSLNGCGDRHVLS
jgi:hypothetical protein